MAERARILYLTSVGHPRVRLQARYLATMLELDYALLDFGKIVITQDLLSCLIRNLPRIILALLRVMIPPIPLRMFIYNVLAASSIIEKYGRKRYDVIFAQWLYPAGFVGLLLSKVIGARVVSEIGGYDIQIVTNTSYGISHLRHIISKYVLRKSDKVIAKYRIHAKIAAELAGVRYQHKILYLPPAIPDLTNLVDVSALPRQVWKRLGNTAETKVVLYSPSLKPIYGISEFLKAVPIVLSEVPDCLFVVAGNGELMDMATRFARGSGLTGRVIFTGRISHNSMISLYSKSTVVCDLCYAGQGTTTLEAFCLGKPVIGIASPKSLVNSKVNGFLVARGDFRRLADDLCMLLKDEKLRAVMSDNARQAFEKKFRIERRAQRLLEVFSCCKKHRM